MTTTTTTTTTTRMTMTLTLTRGLLGTICATALALAGCSEPIGESEAAPPTASKATAGGQQVSASANEAIARRFIEQGLTWKKPATFDELIAPNVVVHTGLKPTGPINGLEEYKGVFSAFAAAFTDIDLEIEDIFTEAGGERVVVRFRADATHTGEFFGMKPTNRRIRMIETHVLRVEDGHIVENRVSANNFEFEYLLAPIMLPMILPDQAE